MNSSNNIVSRQSLFGSNALLAAIAGGFFGIVLLATFIGKHWGYGYFIDEFYYIACANGWPSVMWIHPRYHRCCCGSCLPR